MEENRAVMVTFKLSNKYIGNILTICSRQQHANSKYFHTHYLNKGYVGVIMQTEILRLHRNASNQYIVIELHGTFKHKMMLLYSNVSLFRRDHFI